MLKIAHNKIKKNKNIILSFKLLKQIQIAILQEKNNININLLKKMK